MHEDHRRRWAIRTNCNFTKRARLADLVRPDLETDQRVGAEGVGDRHVSRIAPLSDQHAADSRHVVARVECVPPPAKIGLEPAGEIHWAIGRWHADVPEIARSEEHTSELQSL